MRVFGLLLGMLHAAASSETPASWTKAFPPFRIIGNVYYVGTDDLASYLITTPQGHILINSGLRDTVGQLEANVEKLGFHMREVKILTATHAHWDHAAGLADLQKASGAQIWMMGPDVPVLESGGRQDFRFGKDSSSWFPAAHVDHALHDGETISLGGIAMQAHLHPGHTKGATSFTFNVVEAGKTYRVGIMNMGSINPGVDVNGMATYPEIRRDYARTFQEQKNCRIDIFLSSHASQFHLHEKYKPADEYDPNRFVDPTLFHAEVDELAAKYESQLRH